MVKTTHGHQGSKSFALGDFHKESMGLGIAELVSGVTSLGVVAVADDLIPGINKKISQALSRTVIEPNLKVVEDWSQRLCKLKECKPDLKIPAHTRSEKIAHTLVLFGEAWVVSMLAKMATRKATNEWFKVEHPPEKVGKTTFGFNRHDWDVMLWDEGVHLGAFVLGNLAMAKQTDHVIDGLSGVLNKTLGMSQTKAHNVASMFMIWEVPNLLGFAAGVERIRRFHKSAEMDSQKVIAAAINGGSQSPSVP